MPHTSDNSRQFHKTDTHLFRTNNPTVFNMLFFTSLTLLNLPLAWSLWYGSIFGVDALIAELSIPTLNVGPSGIVIIIDILAIRAYIVNRPSAWWIPLLGSLLVYNIIFFYFLIGAGESLGLGWIVMGPLALSLLLIDLISVLAYMYTHIHKARTRV